jgi:DNA helicase HerA-like ATPase
MIGTLDSKIKTIGGNHMTEPKYMGKIVQSESSPLEMSSKKRRLKAIVREEVREQAREGSYYVIESENGSVRLLALCIKIESFSKNENISFKNFDEFVTHAELEVIGKLSDSGIVENDNGNYHDYGLRNAYPDEIRKWLKLPAGGLYCGDLLIDKEVSEMKFCLPTELLYYSLFVCGSKGSGKTTCLRTLLPRTINPDEPHEKAPSIVILDVEGEFADRGSQGLFESGGWEVDLKTISADASAATATLSLSLIHYEHFAHFVGNLPMNSLIHLEQIYKEIYTENHAKGLSPKAPEILKAIQEKAWRRPHLHESQRNAINRVTMSGLFSMFDQENLPALLPISMVVPGKVTIIDVSSMTDDQQRVVALYLLSIFSSYKTPDKDSTGLLLVLDEAQKLFPHKGDLKREYSQRLAGFVGSIVRRGRRRRYGIILSTQHPVDVARDVVELCDTKIVFRMSGPLQWLKDTLRDAESARYAISLNVGEAFVVSNGLCMPTPAQIKIPAPAYEPKRIAVPAIVKPVPATVKQQIPQKVEPIRRGLDALFDNCIQTECLTAISRRL